MIVLDYIYIFLFFKTCSGELSAFFLRDYVELLPKQMKKIF